MTSADFLAAVRPDPLLGLPVDEVLADEWPQVPPGCWNFLDMNTTIQGNTT